MGPREYRVDLFLDTTDPDPDVRFMREASEEARRKD